MKKILFVIFAAILLIPGVCSAMPPGALVYRTSSDGRMFGYSGDPLIYDEEGIVKHINSGHVGIYIGQENGVEYVVEALSNGIVKTPADKFVNLAEGEKYLGAKIPKNLTAIQQAKVVAIAKNLVGKKLKYDFDFKVQKGPNSGKWTCVGLAEKLYESADISNPNNLGALEYDEKYYALNITPDGFDNYSEVNNFGDCFSADYEFSKIAARPELIIPAGELVGFDVGLIKNDERYIFLPYTQFLQPSLSDVATDVAMSSSFSGEEIRGSVPTAALVLRWSLINNPISSLSIIARKTKDALVNLKDKIFGTNSADTSIQLADSGDQNVIKAGDTGQAKAKSSAAVINKSAGNKNTEAKAVNNKKADNQDKKAGTSVNKASIENKIVSKTAANDAALSADSNAIKNSSKSNSKQADLKKTGQADNTETVKIVAYYNPVKKNETKIAESPKIATINKIYSTGNNKWIELYNPTDQDFDLAAAGYRLEKAKTAADPTLIMRIGNTDDGAYPGGTVIKAHGSYLIVKSTANDYYRRQADAVATRDAFSWPNSGYTIYLGTGAISSNNDEDIVEAIGFGSDATYFQGAGPAQEIIENYSLDRQKSTGNNNLDFKLVKSSDPTIDWDIDQDDGQDSADNIDSNTATDNSNIVATSTDSIATSTDNVASSSSDNNLDLPLIINGLYGTGLNDWVRLFNPNDHEIDLSAGEYRLEKTKAAIDPALMMRIGDVLDGTYPGGTVIKAQSDYLIVRNDANEYFKARADAIAERAEFNLANSGHTIYLANGPVSSSTDENIIDMIGIGPDSTYWRGQSPSRAMSDNFELYRTATSGDNYLDYDLQRSADPNIDWSLDSGARGSSSDIYVFDDSDYDLYIPPEPIDSDGIEYLWHFDECSGTSTRSNINGTNLATEDSWIAGKFACAKQAGYSNGKIVGKFDKAIDTNNFSLSFWFRATMDYPRLSLIMANNGGDSLSMTLEQNLLEFTGLPNPNWRYYQPFAFDTIWRQATLVVNRNEKYWALYIDGEEAIRFESYKILAPMDLLEISGNNGPFAIDELAVWNRALSQDEVIDLRNSEAPYNPVTLREPQSRPALVHFWNFNEGIGTTSRDLIGGANLIVGKNAWSNFALDNSGLTIAGDKNVRVNFPIIESSDISLSLKWRSLDTSVGNRARFALSSQAKNNIFTFIPTEYSSGYYFNDYYSYFSFTSVPSIPLDAEWHYLSLVYDSYRNELIYYVDGEKKGVHNRIWPKDQPLADSLEIAAENGNVEIDDLGVWEGALSPGQIKAIFANN